MSTTRSGNLPTHAATSNVITIIYSSASSASWPDPPARPVRRSHYWPAEPVVVGRPRPRLPRVPFARIERVQSRGG